MSHPRRQLLWRLYPSYLLILLLSLVAVAIYASREVRGSFMRETARDLRARAEIMAALLNRPKGLGPPAEIQARCRDLGRQTDTRFTVVLPAGRPMEEALRNAELHRLLARILDSHEPQEAEIGLHRDGDRYLSAVGAVLHGPENERVGALVVLHDLTHLRRLESVRSEFVANVSHELKTPITAIQGFVETLRDGALADADNAGRFLDIIARHADRLNAIIEDLLALSRLERPAPGDLALHPGRIGDVLAAACQLCEHVARERGVNLTLDGELDLELPINSPLLEQAVVNLCDNAIKYSDRGDTVRLSVIPKGPEAVVSVTDDGCGIPDQDQSRVFERFYRVDKARSREQGGTGLGLALVKHIVNLHQGHVSLESAPHAGTKVRIHLPFDN